MTSRGFADGRRHEARGVSDPARNKWLAIVVARLAGAAGAVFGVVLLGRAETLGPKLLGFAIVLAALAMMAIVPASLARKWRTPPEVSALKPLPLRRGIGVGPVRKRVGLGKTDTPHPRPSFGLSSPPNWTWIAGGSPTRNS